MNTGGFMLAMILSATLGTPETSEQTEPPAGELSSQERAAAAARHADDLLAASPPAPPGDRVARDRAAQELSRLVRLIDAGGDSVTWGVLDAQSPQSAVNGTRHHPAVLVKLYLSLFTFEGSPTISEQNGRLLLEMPVTFRDRLGAGEYPEPLWIAPDQWGSYVRTRALVFTFKNGDLKAVLRRVGDGAAETPAPSRTTRWEWTDLRGRPQPRVAQFPYVMSEENPELNELQAAFEPVHTRLRQAGCFACHAPDSTSGEGRVIYLHSPAAMLSAIDRLPALLERSDLPAGDPHVNSAGGIVDDSMRSEFAKLAHEFQAAADRALAYEQARRAVAPVTDPVLPEIR